MNGMRRFAVGFALFVMTFVGMPKVALAAAGDGLLSYGSSTATIGQKYYTWTPHAWTGPTAGPVASVTTNWTVLKSSPANTGVYVMAMVTTEAANNFKVYSYTGGAWTSEFTVTQSSTQDDYRLFDVAFENVSGKVMVVYGKSASTTTAYYQVGTWNSGTGNFDWTAEASFSFTTSIGDLRWFILANRLAANNMILTAVGTGATNNINARVWDGSSFGNEGGAWGLVQTNTNWDFDCAYETASTDGMVAWGVGANPYWKYATYVGTTWTVNDGPTTSINKPIRIVSLDGDPTSTSDYIIAGLFESSPNNHCKGVAWDGSAWTVTALDNTIYNAPTPGRQVDVKYAGTSGYCVLVYDNNGTADLDWVYYQNGVGWTGPSSQAINGGYDNNIQLVADANSNEVMYTRLTSDADIYAYYYTPPGTNTWTATNGGAALEANSSGGINKESYMFAYETVYRVPTLGAALTILAVAFFIVVLIRKGRLRVRKVEA